MPKFRVKEEIWYELEADSMEAAVNTIIESPDRDKYAFDVVERYAVRVNADGTVSYDEAEEGG